MATRNFVPRADGEGKLGTTTKRWQQVHVDELQQYKQLTGDYSTSVASLGDVTGMTGVQLRAGCAYRIKVRAMMQTNATSVGALLSINCSAAVTSINYINRYPTSATAWTEEQVTALQGGTTPTTGCGTTNTPYWIDGIVVAASDCTLSLQQKSETATATTMKAGSFMEISMITAG